jgi:hypothetical protein
MTEDDLQQRLIEAEKELAVLKVELENTKKKQENLSSGINRGLWILGGGFIAAIVTWITGGGLNVK